MPRAAATATAPRAAFGWPADVRLMNGVASTVYLLGAAALLAAAVLWLTRAPLFTLRAVRLEGELTRNSVNTIRANAMPALAGNFFSVNLQKTRAAFESVPWVRRATVRRVWPDRLVVQLEEHRAAATWAGEDGNDRLVNTHGEVFEANLGDVEDDGLPGFAGPDGTSAQVLAMYRRLQPVFARMDLEAETLTLSGRGSWRVELEGGATLELGRGSEEDVVARTERFVRTFPQLAARYQRQPLAYADLRHTDGYAVRLRGVTTTKTVN